MTTSNIQAITNEEAYTRVTTILNPFTGYDKVMPDILKRAQERGTVVHRLIQAYLENEDLDFLIDILDAHKWTGYLDSMRSFWDDGWDINQMELRYFNDQYMITGQSDVIISTKHGNILIDWKTSSSPNQTWAAQGSAYSWLAKQNGHRIDEIWFVNLDKNGKSPKLYKFKEDFQSFLKCYDCYHLYFKNKPDINLED